MTKEHMFITKDLNVAAFLYASNAKLASAKKDKTHTTFFSFVDKDACEELVRKYWAKEGQIDAKNFADALRSLKDMLFAL